MRKICVATGVLFLALAVLGFAKSRNKDTESPRLIRPSSTLVGGTIAAQGAVPAQTGYWLNSKTGVRHNKNCRWYGKGKNGRPCEADEGRPCKICGG